VICCDAPVPHRLLTTVPTALLGALLAALVVLGTVPAAQAAAKPHRAPDCKPSVEHSAKAATAVFSGTVTADPVRQPRPDGRRGAIYLQTVTVTKVYRGNFTTQTVQVQTDRNRDAPCNLGALQSGRDYMFFVSGSGQPWVAASKSGTRAQNDKVVGQVTDLLGEGRPPIEPPKEHAVFKPADTTEPQSLSRAAAPGAALVIIGLLGLVVVRAISRRSP
jgi:hypothetical protein